MTSRSAAPALLALAVAVSLIACGDDGTPRLTKAAFVRRGDRLCERYNAESGPLLAGISDEDSGQEGPGTLAAAAPVLARVADQLRAHVGRLGALTPPKEADAAFAAARTRLRAGAGALDVAATAAKSGQRDRTSIAFQRFTEHVDVAARWARAYGFRACGRRFNLEETEAAESGAGPLPPAQLVAFCTRLRAFAEGLTSVPRQSGSDALKAALVRLTTEAAALVDQQPPGAGSALGEARETLEAVTKEMAEIDYELARVTSRNPDPLAPLNAARGALEVRLFAIGPCAGAGR